MTKKKVKKKRVRKKVPKFEHIYIELFGANVYYVCCTREEYRKLILKEFKMESPEKGDDVAATAEGYKKCDEIIGVDIIWLDAENPHEIAVIAHECFHVVHNILQRKGVYLNDGSEETYAYMMELIIRKILKKWKLM